MGQALVGSIPLDIGRNVLRSGHRTETDEES
jgi:hypothetical protein